MPVAVEIVEIVDDDVDRDAGARVGTPLADEVPFASTSDPIARR
ncbi:hypothetical protein [Kitasatospora indigofera]|nr:hypothetical protein [Kitasatospora indigofera]